MSEHDQIQMLQARVENLEKQITFLLEHFGLTTELVLDPRLEPIRQSLLKGNMVIAIKQYRELTGTSLRTAKEAVEKMASLLPKS